MGLWRDEVVPRATDILLGTAQVRRLREEVASGLEGEVLEIGFGSGLNLACYPPAVHRIVAIEPSAVAARLAAARIAAARARVDVVGPDAQELPLERASLDAALSTFTLCTIPDPGRALAELRRVLKPGGTFHFLEHGLSPVPRVARWQRRLDPLQRRVAAGCHLDRPISLLIEQAGFVVDELRHDELGGPRIMRPFGYLSMGVARTPGNTSRGAR